MPYFDFTSFETSFNHHIRYVLGKKPEDASPQDLMNAVSTGVGRY